MASPPVIAPPAIDDTLRGLARAGDPDRYVAALLAPRPVRSDLVVLAAFAGEIRRIPSLVREPMMGEIRIQWWRDQLAGLARGEATGSPLADALGQIIRRHRLPLGTIAGYLDATAGDASRRLAGDDGDLGRRHARGDGALLGLAALIHGLEPTGALDEACALGGLALGLARGLSRVPWHLAHGGLPVTGARLAAAGAGPALPPPGQSSAAFDAALAGMRSLAETTLGALCSRLARLPPAAFPPLLPVAMVKPYLAAQRHSGADAARQMAEPSPLMRAWTLWRASRRSRLQ